MSKGSWRSSLVGGIGMGLLVLGAAPLSAQTIRATKPMGTYLPSILRVSEPPVIHVEKPIGPHGISSEPPIAWSDDPTTPQVPTPPKKDETTTPTPETAPPGMDADSFGNSGADSVSTFDSAVGYIDDAIPGTYLRIRFDAANKNNRPSRAEYFYAKGGPTGPGIPTFAGDVDFQELSLYLEGALTERFSLFIDTPWRFIDPQFVDRESGFGDLNVGLKYALLYDRDRVVTFQLRTWAPTGDAREGLGTRHTTIEPGILYYGQCSPKLRVEAEFLYWIPIGGTDFAGDVIQYGVGFSYGERPPCKCWICPVVEFVGWTVLGGKEQVGPSPLAVVDADGDTIVNAKVGFRTGYGSRWNAYFGYGRALTGDVWYENMFRAELRIGF